MDAIRFDSDLLDRALQYWGRGLFLIHIVNQEYLAKKKGPKSMAASPLFVWLRGPDLASESLDVLASARRPGG